MDTHSDTIDVHLPIEAPRTYLQWAWLAREYRTRLLRHPAVAREIEDRTGTMIETTIGRLALVRLPDEIADEAATAVHADQATVAPAVRIPVQMAGRIAAFIRAHYEYLFHAQELCRFLCQGEDPEPGIAGLTDAIADAIECCGSRWADRRAEATDMEFATRLTAAAA